MPYTVSMHEQVAEAQTQRSAAEKAREDSEAACAKAVEEKQAAEQVCDSRHVHLGTPQTQQLPNFLV